MKKIVNITTIVLLLIFLERLGLMTVQAQPGITCEFDIIVQKDDWLSKIADKFYGNPLAFQAIFQATNQKATTDNSYATIENPNLIEPAWKLCVPSAGDAQALVAQDFSVKPHVPNEQFVLGKPGWFDEPSHGPTRFEWRWNGPVQANQGFEVRVWREGEPPTGVHDAVLDNKKGKVMALGNDVYRLEVDIRNTPGVRGRDGEYLWTVLLVEVSPDYKDLGIQATPARLRFAAYDGRKENISIAPSTPVAPPPVGAHPPITATPIAPPSVTATPTPDG